MITKQDIKSIIKRQIQKDQKQVMVKDIDYIVNETFNIIADALKEEEEVLIQNFGKFKVYDVKGYYGTNPKNRAEVIKINNHTKVAFTPGKELKEAVNDKPKNKKGYQPRK